MRWQGQAIEAAYLERRDCVKERNIRTVELEHLSGRIGPSLLMLGVARHFGLAIDAQDLSLRAPSTDRRAPVAAPLRLHAAVAVLLSRSRQPGSYCGACHLVASGLYGAAVMDYEPVVACMRHGRAVTVEVGERSCQPQNGGSATSAKWGPDLTPSPQSPPARLGLAGLEGSRDTL